MKISAKGRYGLAAMVYMTQYLAADCVTVSKISEDLGISKIYLEQVFALLKKAGLVTSIKGSSGGYQLSRPPEEITAFDILNAIEITLFEPAEAISSEKSSYINKALESLLWNDLDNMVKQFLGSVTLDKLSNEAVKNLVNNEYMYYI
ncbi:MAG TPA: Rrf2 family transcriptional regulator [Clostridiaceae bacterium]|nr:Rrf2 family transcriptional regulator [Clostridiaceae bacterium]